MLAPGRTYDEVVSRFRWRIPDRYNIAVDVCDRQDPEAAALIYVDEAGGETRYTFGTLAELSNRLANALAHRGVGRGDRVGILLGQCPETALTHLAVYKLGAVAVIGSPDPVRGEVVKAYLVLAPGWQATPELERQIQEHVRSRLAAHEYPRRISFVEELPLTATGKIKRDVLRRWDREGR